MVNTITVDATMTIKVGEKMIDSGQAAYMLISMH
jgi:hypothetical protein